SPHRGARDAHAALLSLRAGPRSSTLQTAKTAAPAARAAAAVQCERAGGARRRLERAGAQKPKACWAVRGGDEAGGEGERNRTGWRVCGHLLQVLPCRVRIRAAEPRLPRGRGPSQRARRKGREEKEEQGGGGKRRRSPGGGQEDAGCCWLARPPNKKGAAASGQAFPHSS
ncbi:unnamed protein product, partial [Prorocentrum cordatum]